MPTAAAPPSQAPRLQLPDVSLVCVETRAPLLAQRALARCLALADFGEALLLGAPPPVPDPRLTHVAIPPLQGLADYSRFMLRGLGTLFRHRHALVVQWDGFVLDPGAWDPAFLDYDYIGAPWPGPGRVVGNGGFSLRSRRLFDALASIEVADPHPEDHCIAVTLRTDLESRHGIRFAPADLAARFAFEHARPAQPTFGFHGVFNFHHLFDDAELAAYLGDCDPALARSVHGRRLLRNLLRAGMREAAAVILEQRMRGSPTMRLDCLKLRAFAAVRRGRRGVSRSRRQAAPA